MNEGRITSGMDILAKNLLILASAGSGKTFQLGNRVIGLVARGAAPEKIVALTFTRKAAGEFTDSVLTKLSAVASDEGKAAELRLDLALPDADFKEALERVVRALPVFTLGTMDGFFSRIVRGFQYELGLTGGKFELLEGPRAASLADEMLAGILGDTLAREEGMEFFHAFRRATIGREDQGVLNALRAFVTRWQDRYREARDLEWGPAALMRAEPDEWAQRKSGLAAAVLSGLDGIQYTQKNQRETLAKEIAKLESHVIGGGRLERRLVTAEKHSRSGRHPNRAANGEVIQGIHHWRADRRPSAGNGGTGRPVRTGGGVAADTCLAGSHSGIRWPLRETSPQERHARVQ